MTRIAPLLLLLLLAGCRSVPQDVHRPSGGDPARYAALLGSAHTAWNTTPREPERVQRAAGDFAAALEIRADDYDVLCAAARVAAWLGEYLTDGRQPFIESGLRYTNAALELQPEGTEARFFHGVLAGLLGDVDHSYGLSAAKTVESDMKQLVEAGADVAHGGPLRVLGTLQMRAPGPPSSVGSMRNAGRNLRAAVEAAPDWPENHLYLAEYELRNGDPTAGKQRIRTFLTGPEVKAPPGYEFEFKVWRARADALFGPD